MVDDGGTSDVDAAGVTVVIAKFQWVGVMVSMSLESESASQHDQATAAAATERDDSAVNEVVSSPRMQYFIKVVLCYVSLSGWFTMPVVAVSWVRHSVTFCEFVTVCLPVLA